MSITRQQVADLQPGDVVEYHNWDWPNGVTIRGALYTKPPGGLWIGDQHLRMEDGDVRSGDYWKGTLTVVSRAARPLYVNHDRTGAMFGDVVRLENDGGQVVMFTRSHGWVDNQGDEWDPKRKDGLRLLVDGETGRCVP